MEMFNIFATMFLNLKIKFHRFEDSRFFNISMPHELKQIFEEIRLDRAKGEREKRGTES